MGKLKYSTKRKINGYLFIMPWLVGFVLLTAYPLFYSLYLSFHKVKITADAGIVADYIKFANYKDAFFTDVQFVDTLLSYALEITISVPIILVFALIISILLNSNIKFKGLFRGLFFLPVIITSGPVLNELMNQGATTMPGFNDMFSTSIEAMLNNLPLFIANPLNYVITNIIMILWFSGIQILIFLAALQKIDPSVYEAAKVEGATMWEIFWKIMLPELRPMIVINAIYTIVAMSTFSVNEVAALMAEYMFKANMGFGYTSALAWIYLIVIALVLGLYVLILMPREKKYE
ncbi:sugar ABC transporter permease [Mahella sp.]|uniref:carbohydrate ABC transporter permease n=1 Tax=Mahella sp. TaxID=2798721 RepID=UPI0025B7F349|nr:sugar ABC transporter permease [Mahella sp.]MBZ4665288.1 transporter permease [Mahella sp.]